MCAVNVCACVYVSLLLPATITAPQSLNFEEFLREGNMRNERMTMAHLLFTFSPLAPFFCYPPLLLMKQTPQSHPHIISVSLHLCLSHNKGRKHTHTHTYLLSL